MCGNLQKKKQKKESKYFHKRHINLCINASHYVIISHSSAIAQPIQAEKNAHANIPRILCSYWEWPIACEKIAP